MALPILSTAQAYTQQQLRNYEIGNLAADTQAKLTDILLGQQKAQILQQNQQATDLYHSWLQKQLMDQQSIQNNPATGSIADRISAADARNPQMVELRDLQQQQRDVQNRLGMAERLFAPGDPAVRSLRETSVQLDTRIRGVERDVEARRQKDNEAVVTMGTSVDSPEALQQFIGYVGDTFGQQERKKLEGTLLRSPDDNSLIWNEQQQKRLAPFLQSKMSATQAYQIAKERQAVIDAERKAANEARLEIKTDAQIAAMRDASERGNRALDLREADMARKTQAEADRVKARVDRLANVASKPATKEQKLSARSVIAADPDYEGVTFDKSIDALAADVADRAHKLRADAARGGEDLGLDEARREAWEELKPFVVVKDKGGVTIPLTDIKLGGEKQASYVRASGQKAVAGPTAAQPNVGMPADEALMLKLSKAGLQGSVVGGKVYGNYSKREPIRVQTKDQMQLLPSGTPFIGPDGKQWTAP